MVTHKETLINARVKKQGTTKKLERKSDTNKKQLTEDKVLFLFFKEVYISPGPL